ncbi:MAG: ankyrin repeat domain-containing protein [Treponemataceae bacterium]
MANHGQETASANFYIDGEQAFRFFSNLVIHSPHQEIDWINLKKYIENFIQTKEGVKRCLLKKATYFTGASERVHTARYNFHAKMERADIKRESFPLKESDKELGMKEDGVDVAITWNAAKDFFENNYDYMVLCTSDSDFVPLIKGLQRYDVKVILVYFETPQTQLRDVLRNQVDYTIDISKLLKNKTDKNAQLIFKHADDELVQLYSKVTKNKKIYTKQSPPAQKMVRENHRQSTTVNKDYVDFVLKLSQKGYYKNNGQTPLMYVAKQGMVKELETLLDFGVNIDEQDTAGDTALMYAVSSYREEIVKILLEAGADSNKQDTDGKTALMHAAWSNGEEIVKFLLEAGADPNVKAKNGETALSMAYGQIEMLLQLYGAKN